MDLGSFNAGIVWGALWISLIPLIYIVTSPYLKKLQHAAFLILTLAVVLQSLFNVLVSISKLYIPTTGDKGLTDIFNWLYYIFHVFYPAAYAFYIVVTMGFISKSDLKRVALFWIPCWGIALFFLLNPLTQAVYTTSVIDGEYTMQIWSGNYIYWAMTIFYTIVAVVGFIKNIRSVTRRKGIGLIVFNTIMVLGVVLELSIKNFQVQLISESISLVCMLIWFEADASMIDPKTGLYNRNAFVNDNKVAMHNNQQYKIVAISLANQDYLRRAYNDELVASLCEKASKILKKIIKQSALYYCEDGRFAFFYYEKESFKEREYLEEIKEKFEKRWNILEENKVKTSWVINVANVPSDIANLAGLYDIFVADPNGEGVSIYKEGNLSYAKRNNEVVSAFKRGLADNNFEIYLQPIWDAKTNSIKEAEALLRLEDPLLGRLSPSEFISIAEKSGDIKTLGEYAFREAVKFWKEENLKELGLETIRINVSLKQLERDNLAASFTEILREEGVPASDITLEIIQTKTGGIGQVADLAAAGFRLSLDDNGKGYTNLFTLADTDFTSIKLKKKLIENETEKGQFILQKNVEIAKNFEVKVVQEGVETIEQLKEVLSYGVDRVQGYFFSKPLPEEEFLKYLDSYKSIEY